MRVLTVAQIAKLNGRFIIYFNYKGSNFQFEVSKDELLGELKRCSDEKPESYFVNSHGTWHTIFLDEKTTL